ncbi:MAG: hypoxanthine phosphoribosyltransferase [Daejeonella sp.]|uniref:hypoxanthine phosphoribosyltransferase n=1 Tax=Daejeonella sp. TaxID=2805397 RepID=UPI002735DDC2|nr:hypoxanthine phosphoribosyltransferase [Daejeonella sp.]MDP3466926.1 hypoxanthine phosphoribosyltransferase [Daejeonella sp.]
MRIEIDEKNFELILGLDQIEKRIRLLGIQLNVDFENRIPVFVGVLNGSFIFLADLMKEISIASEVTFVKVSSYKGTKSSGKVKEDMGLQMSLKDRDVILVEDIVDSGTTLSYLLDMIYKEKPASISVCTLLMKPKSLKMKFKEISYIGFEIPDDFVVGFGLDYNGLGRNLNDIYRAVGPGK